MVSVGRLAQDSGRVIRAMRSKRIVSNRFQAAVCRGSWHAGIEEAPKSLSDVVLKPSGDDASKSLVGLMLRLQPVLTEFVSKLCNVGEGREIPILLVQYNSRWLISRVARGVCKDHSRAF